jgi:hypothetical protein
LKRFGKKGEQDPLSQVRTKKEKKQILFRHTANNSFQDGVVNGVNAVYC